MKNKLIIIGITLIVLISSITLFNINSKNDKSKQKQNNQQEENIINNIDNNNISIDYKIEDKWTENDQLVLKYNLNIKNNNDFDVDNWKIVFETYEGINISNYWNCKLEINDNTLTINPEKYNRTISKNSEINIGFIIYSKAENPLSTYQIIIDNKLVENTNNEEIIKDDNKDEIIENKNTPTEIHGKLSVSGKNIVDENNNIFIIQGISTHGIAWYPQYINLDTFKTLRDEFNANTIRLALYSDINAGYNVNLHEKVHEGVSYATELGLYVIIDWHILNDNNPNQNKENAILFFKEMATKYKDYNNVIYEICNEPNGNVTWNNDIKPYAQEVITEIRKIDDDAIIIVGTPTWSQDVDIVSSSPIENQKNIIYALHFYAATHKEDLRNKLQIALNNNLPVIVSEFGISDASGNGNIDKNEANIWIETLKNNGIGYVYWNLSNKNESSAMLKSEITNLSNWTDNELTESGIWLKETYN